MTSNLIKKLYDALDFCNNGNVSEFETDDIKRMYLEFDKKFIRPLPNEKGDELDRDVFELCMAERENAFYIGFRAAVDLLMKS
jgi:hypothetical protein